MEKIRIKFHSIFYRSILFYFLIAITILYILMDKAGANINLFDGILIIEKDCLKYIGVFIFMASVLIFSLGIRKVQISKDGIY